MRGLLGLDLIRTGTELSPSVTAWQAHDGRRPGEGDMTLSKPEVISLGLAAVGSWLALPLGGAGWRRTRGLEPFGKHHRERHSGARSGPLWFGFHSLTALEVGSRGEFGSVREGHASRAHSNGCTKGSGGSSCCGENTQHRRRGPGSANYATSDTEPIEDDDDHP